MTFLFILQGCRTDNIDKVIRTYRLVNGTNREVKIDIYERGIFWVSVDKKGNGVVYEGQSSNDAGSAISASGALIGDSIIVSYDNERSQTYYFDETINSIPDSDRNIFIDDHYEVISERLYEFTFTESDYEDAKEI